MSDVLITGGAGFLGTHVADVFASKGYHPIILDNLTKYELARTDFDPALVRDHNLSFLKSINAQVIQGDILDIRKYQHELKDVEFIAHCAAQPTMTLAIQDPLHDLEQNVRGTAEVLDFARTIDAPMVSCSSIHVYGNGINDTLKEGKTRFKRIPVTISEKAPLLQGCVTPLHASKMAAEHYVRAFHDTYGLKCATFRLSGMYGERQFGGEDHGWVANFAIRTEMERPITVFGTDKQVRDILYASDAAEAFYHYFKKPEPSTYTLGGGTDCLVSIRDVLIMLREKTKRDQALKMAPARTGDLWYFVASNFKFTSIYPDWNPKILPHVGVQRLVNWIKTYRGLF